MRFIFLEKYYGYFLTGMYITIMLAISAVIFGTIIGLSLTFLRRSEITIVRFLAGIYIEFIRGTPILVQIYMIYIGLPKLTNLNLSDIVIGIVALSLNSGAYVSEIIRAGIDAVDKGQMEAARSFRNEQKARNVSNYNSAGI